MYQHYYSLGNSLFRIIEKDHGMSVVCRGCGGDHFIDDTQSGDRICTSCGEVVLQNMLSEEPEWRTYKEEGNADDDARVNTFTDSYIQSDSLSTDFMLNGKNLTSKEKMMMKRLEDPLEARRSRKLVSIHSLLEEAENQLDLTPGVTQCAFDIYTKCFKLMHIRGKRSEVISAACLYISCRITGHYRLLSEIVGVLVADLRKVSKLAQVIITELQLVVPLPTEADTINRYCSALILSKEVSNMSVKLLECIKEGNYPNVSGSALNVVAVIMATRLLDLEHPPSIRDFSLVSSKSEQSIIRLYKAVYTHCDAILVSVFKDDLKINAKSIMKMSQKLEPKRL